MSAYQGIVRDRMTQRNMTADDAVRGAYAAVQAGEFAAARDMTAPWTAHPAGALLHALGRAGAGDWPGGAAELRAIAQANPTARHPALDLVDLLRRHARDPAPLLRAALALQPRHPGLLTALGAACAEAGPMAAAVDAFQRAAAARPDDAAAWSNLAKALAATGAFDAAESAFARAAALRPSDPQITLNRAVATLKAGRLPAGWPLFRARTALPGRAPAPGGPELRSIDDVAGRTVLLVHDEGLGDTLQFIRYAPLLEQLGAHVIAAVPPPLQRLLAFNGIALMAGRTAQYDGWCRIPDLPGLFGTALDTIPNALPYLRPDPALVAQWRPRMPDGRRVGLVWAGASRSHDPAASATDRIRSIAEARLGPLLASPGVTWISLQHGRPAPPSLFDPMPDVVDFADTAAIVATLDMVISVDTSVAHLAAAMGKRVLLLDRYDNCWRWLHGRNDSAWYPGVLRIIRQTTPGDWDEVLARAAELVGTKA
jgi:tetratricopeptide (TPR) repeat protein